MVNIENLDPNQIKIDKKSYKTVLIYHFEYVKGKFFRYAKINSVNTLLCFVIIKINRYIKESNWNKYSTLVPIDERKDTLKKFEEIWNKIRDLIRVVTNNSNDCDEKYMKIKFNLHNNLSLTKTLKLYNTVIVLRSVFHKGSKYYP